MTRATGSQQPSVAQPSPLWEMQLPVLLVQLYRMSLSILSML
jgi:hypothetical protein